MRSLAQVLSDNGWRLSGSDPAIDRDDPLIERGIRCFPCHAAGNVTAELQCLICSSAVPADNPELLRAKQMGVPVLTYAQTLGMLMRGRRGLAVAGTHGKSTTTAMAAEILLAAGSDPTLVYGATPRDGSNGGRWGGGDAMLVEACEFRRNFLHLRPREAVILNIEPDHFDCYGTREELEAAFAEFASLLPNDGRLIIPCGDATVARVACAAKCPVETFGEAVDAAVLLEKNRLKPELQLPDWSAANIRGTAGRYGFDLARRGENLGRVELSVWGRHNVGNALAAAAISGVHQGTLATADTLIAALSGFRGLRRRLEPLGIAGGIAFWDDYAHHPTEITTTLRAIRDIAPRARLCCLFQPHQALRTARLLDELASSLQNAERVLIADIFRAREGSPEKGEVTSADLAARTRALGQDVPGCHATGDIEKFLQRSLTPGDVLVVMGAGDIGRIGYGLMDWFRKNRTPG